MSLTAMLRSQVAPGIPGPGEAVLRLAVDVARHGRDLQMLTRATMTAGCPTELADEVWQGSDVPALVEEAGNLLGRVHVSPAGWCRLVEDYLANATGESRGYRMVATALRARIAQAQGSEEGPGVLLEAADLLARGPHTMQLLSTEPTLFEVLAGVVENGEGWMVWVAAGLDLQDRNHSLLGVRLARSGSDAVVGALPWGIPLLDARAADPYLSQTLAYVAQHCTTSRAREILATLGDEWSGDVRSLVAACNEL